jgi:hypothetical protein
MLVVGRVNQEQVEETVWVALLAPELLKAGDERKTETSVSRKGRLATAWAAHLMGVFP